MWRSRFWFRWKAESAKFFPALVTRIPSCKLYSSSSSVGTHLIRLPRRTNLFAILVLTLALFGCSASPLIGFHAADYRETEASAGDSQLLLNILRAKDELPIHFADLSNIHGSIQLTAGSTATLPFAHFAGSATPSSYGPSVGAQTSPTFDVGTLDTQDFTRGILSQLDPRVVKALFDQGVDPRIMMLLFFSEYRKPNGKVLLNTMACDPSNRGLHPEDGCLNQVYAYLSEITLLRNRADADAGVRPLLHAKLQANIYVALRPIGERLSGAWSLTALTDLRQLDVTQYRLIGKQLYSISAPRLAICYERGGKLRPLLQSEIGEQVCTRSEVIDTRSPTTRNVGFSLRSTYDIIEFLGQVLRFQQEKGHNRCLTLSADRDPDAPSRHCDTGETLFQVNAPIGTPVIGTRYGDAWYALYDRSCNKNLQQPCDYSIQVLAILELLLNENKAAKDIIATPRVQVVP
jgi:hypothetical protein